VDVCTGNTVENILDVFFPSLVIHNRREYILFRLVGNTVDTTQVLRTQSKYRYISSHAADVTANHPD
jgi:hypothetical protein